MQDINSLKVNISEMSKLVLRMWQVTFRTFMENDSDLISGILEDEDRVNELEKEITTGLIELGRSSSSKAEKAKTALYADMVGDLELIGDYCKDIAERIQIKIEEKLLFSDEAVEDYRDLYLKAEAALKEITNALQNDDPSLIKEFLKGQGHIDSLVDQYRSKHNQRMIEGICKPFACNMFLNMLDFTAAVYYHAKKIAKNIQKIR